MLLKLFLAFTIIPMIELYILIQAGTVIGTLNTVALVVLSGFIGAYVARLQGMKTMLRIRSNLENGIAPKEEMIDAVIIFVAGIVLLTPGFVTDIVGLLLLFRTSWFYFKRWLRKNSITGSKVVVSISPGFPPGDGGILFKKMFLE